MSATFDATTTAAYAAANTAAERSALIVAALTGTISVKVFNGSNTEMGSGTMDSPWATASGGTVTVGEVTSFTVGTTATPDSNWYIRFQNAGVTRWVRGSFGLSSSSQDFTWSLATWTATHTGTIGTATITVSGNTAPAFTVEPESAGLPATGGTIQFTAVDPDSDSITYSLPTTRTGIVINPATGLVTVDSRAAGTSGNIVVQASDGSLTDTATCAVTVAAVAGNEMPWAKVSAKGPSWLSGVMVADYNAPLLTYSTKWKPYIGRDADILMCYEYPTTWAQFRNVGSQNPAQLRGAMTAVPHNVPIVVSWAMYPKAEPTAGTTPYGTLNTSGGNRQGGMLHIWDNFNYGSYDAHYDAMADSLIALCANPLYKGSDGIQRNPTDFIIRLGWEMNGDWYAWSIAGGASTSSAVANDNVVKFKLAWKRMVERIRAKIPGIWFDFSPTSAPVIRTNPPQYINSYAPDASTYNVLSVSHHDQTTSVSEGSAGTVTRTNPSTWTRYQTYLDLFRDTAISNNKRMALTEWAATMTENSDSVYFPMSQDPEWFLMKTKEWLRNNSAYVAWDTYFSPSFAALWPSFTIPSVQNDAKVFYKSPNTSGNNGGWG